MSFAVGVTVSPCAEPAHALYGGNVTSTMQVKTSAISLLSIKSFLPSGNAGGAWARKRVKNELSKAMQWPSSFPLDWSWRVSLFVSGKCPS